ncbi:hypothetical protein EN809_034845 [Mesorhizobium sp. M2E.F.Ca.ET.166.01.1.1]|nr:hypothetical protein EN809_034845 [Mesorhizobium sp. M2E.F.Ca.ET.166.01.1.1]
MRLKIVPNDQPNADGIWIQVAARTRPGPVSRRWTDTAELYEPDIPEGYHLVGTEPDPPQYPEPGECNHASASWP